LDVKLKFMKIFSSKIEKKFQQEKRVSKTPFDKYVKRFDGNASRLEHSNVRNKSKGKKN